jgi:hypothetical protein
MQEREETDIQTDRQTVWLPGREAGMKRGKAERETDKQMDKLLGRQEGTKKRSKAERESNKLMDKL